MKNSDETRFLSDPIQISWDSAFVFDNVDEVTSHWQNLFKQVIDKHDPVKNTQIRTNQLPWITPRIQKEIRKRNRLFKKYRKHQDEVLWLNYKSQWNKVTKLKRNAIKECFTNAALTSERSVGEFWKKVKSLLPSTSKGTNNDNIALIDNRKLVDEPASVLNEYFTTSLIEENILSTNQNDYIDHTRVQLIKDQNLNLNFH